MAINEYLNFSLVAKQASRKKGDIGEITVRVKTPDNAGAESVTKLPMIGLRRDLEKLENGKLKVEQVIKIGEKLADLLLPDKDKVRALFERSVDKLRPEQGLRLHLDLNHGLADLPWEYMFIPRGKGEKNTSGFLALDPRISIVRYEDLPIAGVIDATPKHRRILIALANPANDEYSPLNLENEKSNIEKALKNLSGLDYEILENTTAETLQDKLLKGADIFHFAGHGIFEETGPITQKPSKEGKGYIVLANENGEPSPMSTDVLTANLQGRQLQLVVLGACQTGRRDGKNVWSGVVAALMQAGIPAAIAMQYTIGDESAIKFSRNLYMALAAGLPLDAAVHAGRLAVFNLVHQDPGYTPVWRDWGVPVLYLRSNQDFKLPSIVDSDKKEPRSIILDPDVEDKEYVKTPEPPAKVSENIKNFTGRTWLLPHLVNWFERTNDQKFILQGGPGTGKSSIIAWLARKDLIPEEVEAKAYLQKIRSHVKAVYYCSGFDTRPKNFAESLNAQLRHNVKEFQAAYSAIQTDQTVEQFIGNMDDEAGFDVYLRKPLRKLYENGYSQPVILLVDALDESLNYTGAINIIQLLHKLFSDLPQKVRFLITTRPDQRVLKYLGKPFDLVSDAPDNVDDVRRYAYERLYELNEESRRSRLAERISVAAKGMFLYAHLVLNDFVLPNLSNLPDLETMPLPEGLSGYYHNLLTRELGNDENRWYEKFQPLFGIVAVALGEGLRRAQIERIIGKPVERDLRACEQCLTGNKPDGPFRLFHKSLSDFLLDDKSNTDYHIDAARMHHQIGNYYWNAYRDDWQECEAYGLNNLVIHLFNSDDPEKDDKVQALMSKEWRFARIVKGVYDYKGYLSDIKILREWARAKKGFDSLRLIIRLQILHQIQASEYKETELKTLVWLGRENDALQYAGMEDLPLEKFYSVLAVYNAFKESGQSNEKLLKDLNELIQSMIEEDERDEALDALKESQKPPDESYAGKNFDKRLAIAQNTSDLIDRAQALFYLAVAMKNIRDSRASATFQAAWEAADAIDESLSQHNSSSQEVILSRHAEILRELSAAMAQFGEKQASQVFDHAIGLVYAIKGYRTEALGAITIVLLGAGRWNEANQVIHFMRYDNKKELVMPKIVTAYANAQRYDEAFGLIKGIQDSSCRADALSHVAMALKKADDTRAGEAFDEAHKLVHEIKDVKERTTLLRKLAVALADAHDNRSNVVFDEAIETIHSIPDPFSQAHEYGEFAIALQKVGNKRAISILENALITARSIKEDAHWASALCKLANTYHQIEGTRVTEITDQVKIGASRMPESERLESLGYLAETLIEVGRHDEAEHIMTSIHDEKIIAPALRKLADKLAQKGSFTEAIIRLGPRSIDEFLLILAEWSPYFEKIRPGMSLQILSEATEVAGWSRPDWQKIHEIICTLTIANESDG